MPTGMDGVIVVAAWYGMMLGAGNVSKVTATLSPPEGALPAQR